MYIYLVKWGKEVNKLKVAPVALVILLSSITGIILVSAPQKRDTDPIHAILDPIHEYETLDRMKGLLFEFGSIQQILTTPTY